MPGVVLSLSLSQDEGEEGSDKVDEDDKNKDIDPRDYIQKASANMDDEYSHKKGSSMQNYYSIAHTLKEPVDKQPTIVINGRLKEYQVLHLG